MSTDTLFQKVATHAQHLGCLKSSLAVLEWDQQTKLPHAGSEYRAQQITTLAGMIHRAETDSAYGGWLNELNQSELAGDPHSLAGSSIRELKRQFDKKHKLPQSLVEELAGSCSLGQQVWMEARQNNDFECFAPNLKKIFELKRAEADAIGFDNCRYDALLDDYEPGAKTADVEKILNGLRLDLVPLVQEIKESSIRPPVEIVRREFDQDIQRDLGIAAAQAIGFDFDRGRIDVTTHPFCTTLGPNDIRLTTRYDQNYFNSAFFGTLHEAGHGIYEQGLPTEHFGLPAGTFCSLGIHESQSRLWENLVGRSFGFWRYFYPQAQQRFSNSLGDVTWNDFVTAVNYSAPSLIRVEADEATYDLHIIIRFELEKALLEDELAVDDLPVAWNEKYDRYLGVTPDTDTEGVLQDVHWSAGLVGYFPTYSLGNIFASEFFAVADEDLGGLEKQFEQGKFSPLKEWLNSKIHSVGGRYRSNELVTNVTGKPSEHADLIGHLRAKLGKIYDLANGS